jgi:hypothetical protein
MLALAVWAKTQRNLESALGQQRTPAVEQNDRGIQIFIDKFLGGTSNVGERTQLKRVARLPTA